MRLVLIQSGRFLYLLYTTPSYTVYIIHYWKGRYSALVTKRPWHVLIEKPPEALSEGVSLFSWTQAKVSLLALRFFTITGCERLLYTGFLFNVYTVCMQMISGTYYNVRQVQFYNLCTLALCTHREKSCYVLFNSLRCIKI